MTDEEELYIVPQKRKRPPEMKVQQQYYEVDYGMLNQGNSKYLNDDSQAGEKQLYPVEFSSPVRDRLRKTTMVESRVVPKDRVSY